MKLISKVEELADQVNSCRWPHRDKVKLAMAMEVCFGFQRHPLIWAACREYSGILRGLYYAEGKSMALGDVITAWKLTLKGPSS